eukprot:GEMP01092227.1.p2 GENE.GEMP01092227.1~~GEMP01092227.1.p2  ORF type:complete len:100 (+),score=12.84 GEMP01092227.1:102-401(+)
MEKSKSEKAFELFETRYHAAIEALGIYRQKIIALQKAEDSEDSDTAAQIRENLEEARLHKEKILQEFHEATKALPATHRSVQELTGLNVLIKPPAEKRA